MLALYEKALQADPEDFETNFNIGILHYQYKHDMDTALKYLLNAIQDEENNVTALFNIAVIYEEKGDMKNAKQYYAKVLEIDPSNSKARVNMGVCLDKEGKSEEAQNQY